MSGDLKSRLDALLSGAVEGGAFPGAVALVSLRGEVRYSGAFGHSMLTPEKRGISTDSIFDMASLTKVIATTTAALQMIEAGRISLSDRVSEIFSDYSWAGGNTAATVEDLMTHTSGFAAVYPFNELPREGFDPVRVISSLHSSLQKMYEPGRSEVYSDLDYILLGKMVERVSGKRLDDYCMENVFKPLGMRDTCFNPPASLESRFVATEVYGDRVCLGTVHDENAYFMDGISGHAGLFSTAADLKIFSDAILGGGVLGGRRILSTASISQMLRQRRPGIGGTFGLGWQLNNGGNAGAFGDLFPVWSFGHTGFTGTMMWMDMKSGLCTILLTNRVHPARDNTAILRYRRLFNNIAASLLL